MTVSFFLLAGDFRGVNGGYATIIKNYSLQGLYMISFNDFFILNRDIIFFIYGLGFFILGFAIILQSQTSSRLELARSLRWLAAFGITHAFNEWGDLFIPLQTKYLSAPMVRLFLILQLILLAVSFACLFEFGVSMLNSINRLRWLRGFSFFLLAGWVFVIFFVSLPFEHDLEAWHHIANALARYFIGFPGGLLAAYGLRLYALRRILPLNVPVIYRNLRIAGYSLAVYAVLGGLIPPPVNFFPGNILNTYTFEQMVGVPPILFRTLISIVIVIAIIRSLEVFNLETQRTIEKLEQQQIISAEHERLARELHDGAIQKVYTAGLLVESASRLTKPETELGIRLERAVVVLNDAIVDLRHNLAELHHPNILQSMEPISELFLKFGQEPNYNSLVKISIDLKVSDEKMLSVARTDHVRAIVNDALSNVVRHAKAKNVKIQVNDLGERLKIAITDDGVGLPPNVQAGYGLRNMRDRSRLLNGEINFSSSSNKGTTITLEIPWVD
jgi:signal transduction histidine kinase